MLLEPLEFYTSRREMDGGRERRQVWGWDSLMRQGCEGMTMRERVTEAQKNPHAHNPYILSFVNDSRQRGRPQSACCLYISFHTVTKHVTKHETDPGLGRSTGPDRGMTRSGGFLDEHQDAGRRREGRTRYVVRARRNVAQGEEITVDWGKLVCLGWDGKEPRGAGAGAGLRPGALGLHCDCGEKVCRRVVYR